METLSISLRPKASKPGQERHEHVSSASKICSTWTETRGRRENKREAKDMDEEKREEEKK